MEDLESLYSRYVPEKVEQRIKNAFGLLRERNKQISTDRSRIGGQHEPQDHRNTANDSDWTSLDMFRQVDHAIHTNMEDWEVVIEICNKLGQNDQEVEEAFRALIINYRSDYPPAQLSAAKLWIVMIYRCDHYFSNHTPRQMLLETIEEIALSSRTSPVVRDRLVEVVGAAVFRLKDAKTLMPYQSTWMKLRLQLNFTYMYPAEGLALTSDDPILSPTSPRTRDRVSQNQPTYPIIAHTSTSAESQQHLVSATRDRNVEREYEQRLMGSPILESDSGTGATDPMDDVRWLFDECEAARGNCRILGDSLLYATSEDVINNPLIKEFQEKTATSKAVIDAHLDSARTKADHARARRQSGDSGKATPRSSEEQLLQVLVTTWVELKNVLQTCDELARLAKTRLRVDPQEAPISRQMTETEVVSHLVSHGCKDLSGSIDPSSFDEYPISQGGFSDVYRGHLLDGREVAMKLLRVSASNLGQYSKHLKHAARELHTWSKCNHPNVVSLFGLAVFRGRIGMVSPWMNRGSLPHYLEQTPEANRHRLCVQICEGLSYLHEIGIIHGDMKGANVLISDDGAPILTDFGNAFLKDRTMRFTPTTSSGALTVRWSAAEIIDGNQPTRASDVYALGMTLYEVIFGKLPYHGHSDITIILLVSVRKEPPARPECIPKGHQVGDELWNLFLRCWSYEPEARPSSVEVTGEITAIALERLSHNLPNWSSHELGS